MINIIPSTNSVVKTVGWSALAEFRHFDDEALILVFSLSAQLVAVLCLRLDGILRRETSLDDDLDSN
jgi:hypothetical protein